LPDRNSEPPLSTIATLTRLGLIGLVVVCVAAVFAYVAGWFSPHRLTQDKIVSAFEASGGKFPGFRRNHAKGVCATGWFDSNGQGAALSKAAVFTQGRVPVVGRFAFAGGMPFVPDSPAMVRSLALRFLPPDGEEWRTGMIDIPVFPVRTAQAFYEQLVATIPDPASGKPDPAKMQAFAGAHPEFVAAVGLIKARHVSAGFGDATYNALNTFLFTNSAGTTTPVRWSAIAVAPAAGTPAATPAASSDASSKNPLFDALIAQVAQHPLQWRIVVTAAQPGDVTSDPTTPWSADHKQVDTGTVTIDKLSSEDDGPCTDVNFDPMVLPAGMAASDDPIPSARSAAYARSFRLRAGERAEKKPSAVSPEELQGSKS
jgi:catalase